MAAPASLSKTPAHIKQMLECMEPTQLSSNAVKRAFREIRQLVPVDSELTKIYADKLAILRERYEICLRDELKEKYTGYSNKDFYGAALYDALMTGCELPYAKHSFDAYNPEIEADIKEIVQFSPQSVNTKIGYLRCWSNVTPLAAACTNENIPIKIVDFLLANGGNPHETVLVNNGLELDLLDDLKEGRGSHLPAERLAAIEKIFHKYRNQT